MKTKLTRFLIEIIKLLKKEFLFDRYDELTGNKLPYSYRGVTLWVKEVIESLLAWIMIGYFIYLTLQVFPIFFHHIDIPDSNSYNNPESYLKFLENQNKVNKAFYTSLIQKSLYFAGVILILDSILLIAALISSPGIDETIDSISISSAGIFILILGYIDFDKFINSPLLILQIFFPLTLIIMGLILVKHILKRWKRIELQKIQFPPLDRGIFE